MEVLDFTGGHQEYRGVHLGLEGRGWAGRGWFRWLPGFLGAGVDAFPWPWVRSRSLSSLRGKAESAQDTFSLRMRGSEAEVPFGRLHFWECLSRVQFVGCFLQKDPPNCTDESRGPSCAISSALVLQALCFVLSSLGLLCYPLCRELSSPALVACSVVVGWGMQVDFMNPRSWKWGMFHTCDQIGRE